MWTYKKRNFPYFASAAVSDDLVLIGSRDKRIHAINRKSGKGVWEFQTRGHVDSSPIVVGKHVVAASKDGRVYAINLREGTEYWAYDTGSPIIASPAIANGILVIATSDGQVLALSVLAGY